MQWRSPRLTQALADATELWLETDVSDDPAAMAPLMLKYGVDPAKPLSKRLAPADYAKLDAAAKVAGMPGAQAIDTFRPWLASVTLGVVPLIKAGYDLHSGVEARLKADAASQGDAIKFFETLDEQCRAFAELPPAVEQKLLLSTLDAIAETPSALDKLVAAWAAGDVGALDTASNGRLRDRYPDVYRILVTDRNRRWAELIRDRLAGKGVSLVAVGASHVVGPDSLQTQLAKLGIESERR
jgi:hypothetical protein